MIETLTELAVEWGYWGLFAAALIAGTILPFSSEATMVAVVALGVNPVGCLVAATLGNTLGGMTCYWIGTLGRTAWIERLGVSHEKLERAQRLLAGRGAWMAFFAFLPTIGEAIAVCLGLMRSNIRITALAMLLGKGARYAMILATYLLIGNNI